jgi:hypothetical protein
MTTWKTWHKLEDTIEMDLQEVEEGHGFINSFAFIDPYWYMTLDMEFVS